MATLLDVRARGRRYHPRHHPGHIQAEQDKRAELRQAIAEQYGARPPRRAYTYTQPAFTYHLQMTTSTTSTSFYMGNRVGTATTLTNTSGLYVAGTSNNTETPYVTTVSTSVWDNWAQNPRLVVGNTRPIWTMWDTMPAVKPRKGQVYDHRMGQYVSQKEMDRRQLAREAEANRLRDEMMARRLIVAEARVKADARASELLGSLLSDEDRERYERSGVLDVRTPSGRHVQLRRGWAGNAVELCPRTGRRLRRFCIHPATEVPDDDNVAAQLLMLQTDEEAFFRIANASEIRA